MIQNESVWYKVPNDLPVEYLATLSINPTTALRMLRDFVCLEAGESKSVLNPSTFSSHGRRSRPCLQLPLLWSFSQVGGPERESAAAAVELIDFMMHGNPAALHAEWIY